MSYIPTLQEIQQELAELRGATFKPEDPQAPKGYTRIELEACWGLSETTTKRKLNQCKLLGIVEVRKRIVQNTTGAVITVPEYVFTKPVKQVKSKIKPNSVNAKTVKNKRKAKIKN